MKLIDSAHKLWFEQTTAYKMTLDEAIDEIEKEEDQDED